MRRSVRNGLAVAGIAGGLWFLGNAVANADTGSQNAACNADTSVSQTDHSNANDSSNACDATNVQKTEVDSTVKGGNGGDNSADINTGVQNNIEPTAGAQPLSQPNGKDEHKDGDKSSTTTVTTGDVNLSQAANGGDVSGSGNSAVQGNNANQTAQSNATTTVDQTSTSNDKHGHDGDKGPNTNTPTNNNNGGNSNESDNSSSATNVDKTQVDTTVKGGNGGINSVTINTGLQDVTFYCPKGGCTYNITTGNVTVNQQANGGNVTNSGNVGVNAPVPGQAVAPCNCVPCPQAAKPAVKKAAIVHPVVLSAAQPTGVLATTGAETSTPLTVGLIALAAGTGLTLAGRRRQTAGV